LNNDSKLDLLLINPEQTPIQNVTLRRLEKGCVCPHLAPVTFLAPIEHFPALDTGGMLLFGCDWLTDFFSDFAFICKLAKSFEMYLMIFNDTLFLVVIQSVIRNRIHLQCGKRFQ